MDRKPSVFTSVEELATSSRKENISPSGVQRTAEIRSLHGGVGFELTTYYDKLPWHESSIHNLQLTLGKFAEGASTLVANIKMTPDLKRGGALGSSPADSSEVSSSSSTSGCRGRKRKSPEGSEDRDSHFSGDSSCEQGDSPDTPEEVSGEEEQRNRKKAKTSFSTEQVDALERCYQEHKYLPANIRRRLANSLQLTDTQVKTWFQNRRMKQKRQRHLEENTRAFFLPTGGVDVSQLKAMGIPCPPPHVIHNAQFPVTTDFASPLGTHRFGTPQDSSTPNRAQVYRPSPVSARVEGFLWSKDSCFKLVSPSGSQSPGQLHSTMAPGHVPMTSYLVDTSF